jgi:hypothetical protein
MLSILILSVDKTQFTINIMALSITIENETFNILVAMLSIFILCVDNEITLLTINIMALSITIEN